MNNIVYKISMDGMSDAEARAAVALQGLANRYGSNIFLVPGRERSVWSQVDKKRFVSDTFSDEELEKYPDVEAYWIEYFSKAYGFEFKESGFEETFSTFKGYVKGCVKYDEATSGTIVFTMAGLFDALPVTDALIQKYPELNNLPVIYDITGRFKDKYEAHEWAVNEFLEKTNKQFASSSFTEAEGGTVQNDYAVMNKAFVFQMNFLSQENLRHAVEWEQKTYDPKAEPIVDKIFEHIDKFIFNYLILKNH